MDGVLFAFERHFDRMRRDAALMRIPFPGDPHAFESSLLALVEANHANNATLRVVVVRNRGGMFEGPGIERDYDVIAFTRNLKNWGRGVRLALVPNARFSAGKFTSAKILSWSMNLTWLEEAQERGYDEALLMNERGEIAECTSANIFAAFGDEVRTPPVSAGCLPGVTREILLHEVHVPGARVVEAALEPEDLEAADAVFITSTTRDLLPVDDVEGLKVRHEGKTRGLLENAFGHYMDEYVARAKGLRRAEPVVR